MPLKSSHLRQVSKGSLPGDEIQRAIDEAVDHPLPTSQRSKHLTSHQCVLGTHDDKFSRQDVLLNPVIFVDGQPAPKQCLSVTVINAEGEEKTLGSGKSQQGTAYMFIYQPVSHDLLARHQTLEACTSFRSGLQI